MFRRPWIPQWKQTNDPWCGPKTEVFQRPDILRWKQESQTYFIRGPRILVSEPHNYISPSTAPNQQLRQIGNPRKFRHTRGGHVKPGGHTVLYIFILWKLMYVYLMSIDTFKTLPLKWFLDRPEPFQFITLLHDQVVTICWSTGLGLSRLLFHLYILIQ